MVGLALLTVPLVGLVAQAVTDAPGAPAVPVGEPLEVAVAPASDSSATPTVPTPTASPSPSVLPGQPVLGDVSGSPSQSGDVDTDVTRQPLPPDDDAPAPPPADDAPPPPPGDDGPDDDGPDDDDDDDGPDDEDGPDDGDDDAGDDDADDG